MSILLRQNLFVSVQLKLVVRFDLVVNQLGTGFEEVHLEAMCILTDVYKEQVINICSKISTCIFLIFLFP